MSLATDLLPWLAAGVLLGAAYLFLIAHSIRAIGAGAGWRAIALTVVLRVLLAVAALGFAARHGAVPLLLVLCGFLLARTVAIRRTSEA